MHAYFDAFQPPVRECNPFKVPPDSEGMNMSRAERKAYDKLRYEILHKWDEHHQRIEAEHAAAILKWHDRQAELKAIITGLGCDSKMFRRAATARMPGWFRAETERMQCLYYLDPLYEVEL